MNRPTRFWYAGLAAVAALLACCAWGRLMGDPRERFLPVSCAHNLKQIAVAALLYADDHGGVLPDERLLRERVENKLWLCPEAALARSRAGQLADPGSDYAYVGGGLRISDREQATTVIAYDKPGDHVRGWSVRFWYGVPRYQTQVLFADGHVERTPYPDVATPARIHAWHLPPSTDLTRAITTSHHVPSFK